MDSPESVKKVETPVGASLRFVLVPALQGLFHFGLRVDAEGVGDAIDVIEVRDHLDGVQDVAVAEAMQAQGFDVLLPDRRRRPRHPLGKLGEALLTW